MSGTTIYFFIESDTCFQDFSLILSFFLCIWQVLASLLPRICLVVDSIVIRLLFDCYSIVLRFIIEEQSKMKRNSIE